MRCLAGTHDGQAQELLSICALVAIDYSGIGISSKHVLLGSKCSSYTQCVFRFPVFSFWRPIFIDDGRCVWWITIFAFSHRGSLLVLSKRCDFHPAYALDA